MKEDVHNDSETPLPPGSSEHEQLIHRLLNDPAKKEALEWLKGGMSGEERTVGTAKTNRDSIAFVKQIYDLGAVDVFAVNIHLLRKGNGAGERTGKLVVSLPQSPAQRKAIFDWCKEQGDSLGFTPDPDQGESHLFLLLD